MYGSIIGSTIDLLVWSDSPSDDLVPPSLHRWLMACELDDDCQMLEYLLTERGELLVNHLARWQNVTCACCDASGKHSGAFGCATEVLCGTCEGHGFFWASEPGLNISAYDAPSELL
jgi:hypothetical protein